MKKKKILFPLIALLSFSSCSNNELGFKEYYDSSWTQGENAITNVTPSNKNPEGKMGILNEIRRSQNKVGLPSMGKANLLVVPINFKNDVDYQKMNRNVDITISDKDITNINDVFFGKDRDYPSIKEYYSSSSFGKLELDGVVSPVVTLPKEYTDYLTKSYLTTPKQVISEIVEYVYDYLFEETKTYYIGDFDSDNDGRVDAINLICNYPADISFDNADIDLAHINLMAHDNVYFTSDLLNSNKTKVNSYSMLSDSYRIDYDTKLFTNQVGRMIGLDAYDDQTGNVNTGYYRAPLSYFDMMSGFVGDHNPFSKYQLGWIEPKFIKSEDIKDEMTITLKSSITSGESLVLYCGEKSLFGEYLIVDLYTVEALNKYEAENYSPYGLKLFDKAGIRVYQVDSTLVRGYNDSYLPYYGSPNFKEEKVLPNGEKVKYIYDYAYSNNSSSKYGLEGSVFNYPLVSLLSKNGANRHMTNSNNLFTANDLFLEGDSFGSDNQIEGFYKNFAFHSGERLNITFTVDKVDEDTATITLRRVK